MKKTQFKHNSNRKRKFLKLSVLLLIIALGVGTGAYLYFQNQQAMQLAEQKERDEAQITSTKKAIAEEKSGGLKPKTSSDIKQDIPTSSNVTVSITSTSQSNGSVRASATVAGADTTGAFCIFTYTNPDDKPVTSSSVPLTDGSCSTETPEVNFSKLGVWNLNVTTYISNTKSEANQSVTIN